MNEINPFAGSILQSTQVQHQQSADKSRQIRHQQALTKDTAAPNDEYEHVVESTEELTPIHEEGSKQQPRKRRPKAAHQSSKENTEADDKSHLDLTT